MDPDQTVSSGAILFRSIFFKRIKTRTAGLGLILTVLCISNNIVCLTGNKNVYSLNDPLSTLCVFIETYGCIRSNT